MDDLGESSSSSSTIGDEECVNIKTERKRYKKNFFVGYKPQDVCEQTRNKLRRLSSQLCKTNVLECNNFDFYIQYHYTDHNISVQIF